MFDALKLLSPETVQVILGGTITLGTLSIAFLSHRLGYKNGYKKAEDNINERMRKMNEFTESLKERGLL